MSNLIWWPWHGLSAGGPPPTPGWGGLPMVSGDKNPPLIEDSWGRPRRSRRRLEDEEEDIIAVILDSL